MNVLLTVLIVLAMLGAAGALLFGLISMARGGDARRSNKLMQSRIILQGLALLLFALFMSFFHHG
jgi:hypothetical protein